MRVPKPVQKVVPRWPRLQVNEAKCLFRTMGIYMEGDNIFWHSQKDTCAPFQIKVEAGLSRTGVIGTVAVSTCPCHPIGSYFSIDQLIWMELLLCKDLKFVKDKLDAARKRNNFQQPAGSGIGPAGARCATDPPPADQAELYEVQCEGGRAAGIPGSRERTVPAGESKAEIPSFFKTEVFNRLGNNYRH